MKLQPYLCILKKVLRGNISLNICISRGVAVVSIYGTFFFLEIIAKIQPQRIARP